jgi:predicted amidophosphoribosyltransferase
VRLFEAIAEFIYPTRCAGCELPGSVLCDRCRDTLRRVEFASACPRCGAPYGALVCTECWNREWAFSGALSLGEFEGQLARAVALHKDAGERRLGAVLGELLAADIAEAWPGWADVVVFVPATRAAFRRRGFDHGRLIAAHVAEKLGVPLADTLERAEAVDQRTLGREDRVRNASGSFSAAGPLPLRVLLCDDVFTTGATLDAAAEALLAAGAGEVRCAAVARAW